ncbi:type II secretion system protein N [Rivibacter subsaxonicus]|uniref:Type II secretion system protein N n=1 Tax=Rivibacter subsaxonicus TaxID=457575 RepID=A0A4V6MEQ6_9BURK|nr:type II secretion system protein N [Rivibacter subsaxonicus]RZU02046.1 general secretion pathway protein N [Rivibacter subsaxonicus]
MALLAALSLRPSATVSSRGAPRLGRSTEWHESTLEEMRWERADTSSRRWAIWGTLCGALAALVLFAPAAWLASSVASGTGGRVILADASGSIWNGSAVAVLAGGEGSRDARALPGRIEWKLRPALNGLKIELAQDCCISERALLTVTPGIGRVSVKLHGAPGWIGQWPAQWLAGLGTPWNTLQLGGALRLSSPDGIALHGAKGRWRVDGSATLDLLDVSSRVSTLDRLGSYRLSLASDPGNAGRARLELSTTDGALQLSGSGEIGAGGVRFRGEASAQGDPAPLQNLLNIIGRRDGARSVIVIG